MKGYNKKNMAIVRCVVLWLLESTERVQATGRNIDNIQFSVYMKLRKY